MEKVIVTVKLVGESQVRDVELSSDVPAEQLAAQIAVALGWHVDAAGNPITYLIEAHPPDRILHSTETLAQAGAWDGSWLVFHPESSIAHPIPTPPPFNTTPPSPAPSRPAEVPPASSTMTEPETAVSGGGFVWKRVDDD